MSSLGNKKVFSKNLKYYIEQSGQDRKELAKIWGFPYSTLTEWINGKKYPRIDRIEIMADYFGILKSDLIEDKANTPEDFILSEGEKILINVFRQIPEEKQKAFIEMGRLYANSLKKD